MKILTFVIPAYNSERFLNKCISSMLALEILEKLEILVVNDGSTDKTAAVAQRHCDRYPDVVRLIPQENKGHGGALNAGCAAARGKYLKVIDADDWVETVNLPAFVEFLEQCESDVVLTHHHTHDIATGKIECWRSFPPKFGRKYTLDEVMEDWFSFERSLTFHGITYRTAFYQEKSHPLPEHVFYEDHGYATYPCCYAKSITPLDLFVYEYRIGDVNQSISNVNQLQNIDHIEVVIREMIREYPTIQGSGGKAYAVQKIHGLVLSYLTTALLAEPDRKAGRELAKRMMAFCAADAPAVFSLARKQYLVYRVLNRLHISKDTWNRLIHSDLYLRLRRRRSFD